MNRTFLPALSRLTILTTLALVTAALALVGAGPASAAGPCSRGACLTLDSSVEPHTGSATVQFDVDVSSSAAVNALTRASLTIRTDNGLVADLASVKVYNVAGAGKPARNGNDITVDLAASSPLPAPTAFAAVAVTVTPQSGAAAVLHAAATVTFAARNGDPALTTTSSATVYNAPQVKVDVADTINPYNYARTALPHGRTSLAEVTLADVGLRDAPAGLPLRLTFSGGAALGASTVHGEGVRWGITESSQGSPLTCTVAPDRTSATCLTRRLVAGGEPGLAGNTYLAVPVAIPAGQAVGTANSLTVSLDVPGDPVTTDNSDRLGFTSGPVSDLRATVSARPDTIPVGGSGVVTVRVTNRGPDASSRDGLVEIAFDSVPRKAGTVRPLPDGKHDIGQVAQGSATKTFQAELPALRAGASFDIRFRVSAKAVRTVQVRTTPDDTTSFNLSCNPDDSCTTSTRLLFTAATSPPATPTTQRADALAASGSRTGMLLGVAAALLLAGCAAQAAGRRRPSN